MIKYYFVVVFLLLLQLTKILCQDPANDIMMEAARKSAEEYAKVTETFCKTGKIDIPGGLEPEMPETGKTCKPKWNKERTEGIDASCMKYPEFCHQMKIPDELIKAYTTMPCFTVNECMILTFLKMQKLAKSTAEKCMLDLSLSWYIT